MAENKVRMVALWPFSGPEGGDGAVRRIARDQEFETTPRRAKQLQRSGKARPVASSRRQTAGPSERQDGQGGEEKPVGEQGTSQPTGGPSETRSVKDILADVDSGKLKAQEVLDAENEQESPRTTLVTALEQRLKDGE